MPGSEADRTEKRARLHAVREAARADALLLTSHEAVSWYLEGIRSHVSLAGPPVAAVRVDRDGDTLFVADNEADRLLAEELLPSDAARVVRVPWLTPPAEAAAAAGDGGCRGIRRSGPSSGPREPAPRRARPLSRARSRRRRGDDGCRCRRPARAQRARDRRRPRRTASSHGASTRW